MEGARLIAGKLKQTSCTRDQPRMQLTCVLAASTQPSAMIWAGVYTVDARIVSTSMAGKLANSGSAMRPCTGEGWQPGPGRGSAACLGRGPTLLPSLPCSFRLLFWLTGPCAPG